MHTYAAFLGHQPMLSIAELAALLPDFRREYVFGNQVCVFSTGQELDQEFLDQLGGTILLAQRITGEKTVPLSDIPVLLKEQLEGSKGKVTFSLRTLGVARPKVRELFRDCKNFLKQNGKPSRYVGNENEPAKPIVLHDSGVLDRKSGCEIVVLKDKEHQWIGRTVAAQNVKAYTQRDIGKPVRDTTVGLLPPKLAQTLLNFGLMLVAHQKIKLPKDLTVFDPFCGTGVIPLEAMLRGYHVLASDVSLKAVNGCEKNIDWARKTYKIAKKDVETTVWKQDAAKPFALKHMPDIVVTEGSLGPALKDRPLIKEAEKHRKEAEKLNEAFLRNCKETLPGVPVVMTWPVWYAQKKQITLERLPQVCGELGYTMLLPPHTSSMFSDHTSLLYRRPDQLVGREIVLLLPR